MSILWVHMGAIYRVYSVNSLHLQRALPYACKGHEQKGFHRSEEVNWSN